MNRPRKAPPAGARLNGVYEKWCVEVAGDDAPAFRRALERHGIEIAFRDGALKIRLAPRGAR